LDNINLNEYIKSYLGDIPLILSVPHGGDIKLPTIPDRINGILGIDLKTIELAYDLIKYLKTYSKKSNNEVNSPSYLISLISRSKIDFNRNESEAFDQKSNLAKLVFNFYHQKIMEFISFNLRKFNTSLLIDIHGFERNKRPEGYRDVDLVIGSNNLGSIYGTQVPKKFWGKNIRGKIVKAFNKKGILLAPGHHLRKEYVLTGGYITTKYGASNIPNSQSIQIEFSDRVRLYNKSLRKDVLKTLAQVIYDDYILKHI
jgi:N-formylglutamate amidohydrolase